MNHEQLLWTERYRPHCIADCILPAKLKETFQQFVDQNKIPNLLLTGGPGVGKTTVAKAMLDEVDCDYIVINGSMNGNIDTLRNEILQFASSVSFKGGRKYVILDEADYLNAQSTQPALRNFIEEFSNNCGFVFTANYKNRIIQPLHSRCSVVDFKIPKSDKPVLAGQFMKRALHILDENNVTYKKEIVAELITRYFPDWRRVLNELQRFSATGTIDEKIFAETSTNFKVLIEALKAKDFGAMRKWIGANSDFDSNTIFRELYDSASSIVKESTIPNLILILAEAQYKISFVADPEITLVATMLEIMTEVDFK